MQAGSSLGYPHEGPYDWDGRTHENWSGGPVAGVSWGEYLANVFHMYEQAYADALVNPPASAAQGKSAQPSAGSSSGTGKITETKSVYVDGHPELSHMEVDMDAITFTAKKPFNFWKSFWASFKSGFRIFNWDGSTAGEQTSGEIMTSDHADDAKGREPNLTTKATGKIYGITNIDFLLVVLGNKGGSEGVSQMAEIKEGKYALQIIEGGGAAVDQSQEAIDHIYGPQPTVQISYTKRAPGHEQIDAKFDPNGSTHRDTVLWQNAINSNYDSFIHGMIK